MRVAALAVGAAVVGSASVLLSVAPPAPASTGSEPRAFQARAIDCPPCNQGPLGPIGWLHAVARPDGEERLQRAAALSLSMGDPAVLEQALHAEDATLRELAALLLNVASGRVAGCTPLGNGSKVAAVLDRLDRLVAHVRDHRPVPADELAAAAAAAAVLNRGEGLPAGCSG